MEVTGAVRARLPDPPDTGKDPTMLHHGAESASTPSK